eukprot:TRINITY_DN2155_c0_g1_i1.p1 TRINITY_DN2155_c0_g1~~TRINITY_DN2155_c0_g1_i1.p1  ORF type:complete len:205 (+),score=15.93 TRINITY_DN2155_c0_g1_i1:360-974(+)
MKNIYCAFSGTRLVFPNHRFLVNITSSFANKENLYLVMNYFPGGDLRFHLSRRKTFVESETSSSLVKIEFLVACIVTALEYIHNNGIIHRDVKPENLLFDGKGYLHLTDFGIARIWREENAQDTSGTPGYMGKCCITIWLSTGSDVQKQPWGGGGLLCGGRDSVRVHDGQKAVHRKNAQGNPRPDPCQTGPSEGGRSPCHVVSL